MLTLTVINVNMGIIVSGPAIKHLPNMRAYNYRYGTLYRRA